MPSTQRARSGVPLDQRSAVPSIPGIPAWGAVAVAVGAAFLGVVLDAFRGTELTNTFAVLYVIGCLVAVLAVRNRGVFTAIAQTPLIIFFGVPVAYQFLSEGGGSTTIKDFVLNAAVPLVNRFPLMLFTTLAILAIGVGRVVFAQGSRRAPKPKAARRATSRERAAAAPRERAAAPAARTEDVRDDSVRDRPTAPRRESTPPPRITEPRADRSRSPEPRTAPPRSAQPRTSEPTGRVSGDPLRRRPNDTPRRRDDDPLFGSDPRRRVDRPASPEQPGTSSRRASHAAEPVSRESISREPSSREPIPRRSAPREPNLDDAGLRPAAEPRVARRIGADNPALQRHSAPQVRYRDRRD